MFCGDVNNLYIESIYEQFPSGVADLEVVAQALVDHEPHTLHLQREHL